MNFFKKNWYVLYVKPRREKKVYTSLGIHALQAYLPLVKRIKKWSDRKKTVHEPLFSSYVFIYADSRDVFSRALAIDGVLNFVKFGGKHASVSAAEINNIKILLEGNYNNIEVGNALPKIGELKIITQGLFAGLECEVVKAKDANKIVVRVDSIHMNITAELPSKYLEIL